MNRKATSSILFCLLIATPVFTAQTKNRAEQPLHRASDTNAVARPLVRLKISDGVAGGWLFLPESSVPSGSPVIVFCHGWGAVLPRGYQAWIDHLVMRGNIVLWPNYQNNLRTPTRMFLPNAIAAVNQGLKMLRESPNGIHADLNRMAVVGHSAGGMVAAGIAASASSMNLPAFKVVMPVEPGDSKRGGVASVPLADMSKLPENTLLLIVAGEEDTSVGTYDGERILHESTRVPPSRKALFMLHSDDHAVPALVANHFAPAAALNPDGSYAKEAVRSGETRNTLDIGVVNALDFGLWHLLDNVLDAAFSTPSADTILHDPRLLDMGKWPDGVPIKPLTRPE